jgi:hypothetical protein
MPDILDLRGTVDDAIDRLNSVVTNFGDRITKEEAEVINNAISEAGNVMGGLLVTIQNMEEKVLKDFSGVLDSLGPKVEELTNESKEWRKLVGTIFRVGP